MGFHSLWSRTNRGWGIGAKSVHAFIRGILGTRDLARLANSSAPRTETDFPVVKSDPTKKVHYFRVPKAKDLLDYLRERYTAFGTQDANIKRASAKTLIEQALAHLGGAQLTPESGLGRVCDKIFDAIAEDFRGKDAKQAARSITKGLKIRIPGAAYASLAAAVAHARDRLEHDEDLENYVPVPLARWIPPKDHGDGPPLPSPDKIPWENLDTDSTGKFLDGLVAAAEPGWIRLSCEAGNGKTTLLKYLSRAMLGRLVNGEAGRLPILLHAQQVVGKEGGWPDILYAAVKEQVKAMVEIVPDSAGWADSLGRLLREMYKKGRLFVMVDGLDQTEYAASSMKTFMRDNPAPQCPILVGGRNYAFDFQEYLTRAMRLKLQATDVAWRQLYFLTDYSDAEAVASRAKLDLDCPLLCYILRSLIKRGLAGKVQKKADLYNLFIRDEMARAVDLAHKQSGQSFDANDVFDVFRSIAFWGYEHTSFLGNVDIDTVIRACEATGDRARALAIFRSVGDTGSTSRLSEFQRDLGCSFRHLALQEYLAATIVGDRLLSWLDGKPADTPEHLGRAPYLAGHVADMWGDDDGHDQKMIERYFSPLAEIDCGTGFWLNIAVPVLPGEDWAAYRRKHAAAVFPKLAPVCLSVRDARYLVSGHVRNIWNGPHGFFIQEASLAKERQQKTMPTVAPPVVADGLTWVWIPPGIGLLRNPDPYRGPSATAISVSRGFWMTATPITQAQWCSVLKEHGAGNPSIFRGDQNPVETISWETVVGKFLPSLARLLGPPWNTDVALPTQAEWEYAARAGCSGQWCYGNDTNMLMEYAWYAENSGGITHPVGQKRANAWGLFDMYGNVWELCQVNQRSFRNVIAFACLCGGGWQSALSWNHPTTSLKDCPTRNDIGFRVCVGHPHKTTSR